MTAPSRHQAHDSLLAHVQRVGHRLEALTGRIEALDTPDKAAIASERESLTTRCQELLDEIRSWTEIEIGIPAAVENLESAVDTFEADLDALSPADPEGRKSAIDRQIRAWKQRVDWLRLQSALGAMQARDDLEDLTRRLDGVRGQVFVELQTTAEDSKEVIVDLRRDVEKVLVDVRRVVSKATSEMTKR